MKAKGKDKSKMTCFFFLAEKEVVAIIEGST